MTADEGTPERIVGRRAVMSRRERRITWAASAVAVGYLIWMIVTDGSGAVILGLVLTFNVVMGLRPPTVVDGTGIRRGWRRPSFVPWEQVRHVVKPPNGTLSVVVQLTSGKTMALVDISEERSYGVAALGGVPLVRPEWTVAPPPRPTRRTDQDIEADVDRRAQALADRGRLLDAEYRRIRGERPPGTS